MRRSLLPLAFVLSLACSARDRTSPVTTASGARAIVDALATFPEITAHGAINARDLATGFWASMPSRAGAPMRVGVSELLYVDISAEGDAPIAVTRVGGSLVYPDAQLDTDVVIAPSRAHVEELRLLRTAKASSVLRYRLRLGPEVADVRVRMGLVEVLDRAGNARLRSDRWFAVDSSHRRIEIEPRLTGEGSERVLEGRVDTAGATYPIAVDPGWGPPATLGLARVNPTATVLASGKVLVVGGEGLGSTVLSAAEIFDPTTRTWTIAKAMGVARRGHASVALASGKVLVVAGSPSTSSGGHSTAELYDPTTDTWTAAGKMADARVEVCAALLQPSGKVLVAGGLGDGVTSTGYFTTAELWNPSTSTFTTTTNGSTAGHVRALAEAIGGDKAIVIGGNAGVSAADVYDATTNSFVTPASMAYPREDFAAVKLASGGVFVVGGWNSSSGTHSSAEIFDTTAGAFTVVKDMPGPRQFHLATRLSTGKVLVAAGWAGELATPEEKTAVLYDPIANTWSSAGTLGAQRRYGAIAPLPGGGAIVVGGQLGLGTTPTSSVEIYGDALAAGASCTSAGQCTSGQCADGVCCDRACTGACEACNESGSVGTCKLVTGAPRGSRPACVTDGACSGSCSGTSAFCAYPSASVVCVAATCVGGISTGAAYCNGAGSCGMAPTAVNCDPYNCGATSCKTSCVDDTDCVASSYCEAGKCVLKKKQGDACAANGACATGFCADGVCCDTACADACKACNVPGSIGVCSAGPCDDAGVTTDGGVTADAPAPDAGPTPKVEGSYQKCAKNSECPSGFCVEGVCCDSACKERCHSCALLTSPGKCTLEPIGVDLKNECGAALSCVGTCGPGGECVGAGQGTMCARNRCTGPTAGVGPAYCPGPGGACGTDQVVPFDCAPYLCEPAFGACSGACNSSDDCARGFVCDVPSKTCTPIPPAAEEDSGCSLAPPRRRAGDVGTIAIALTIIVGARRRHRLRSRRAPQPVVSSGTDRPRRRSRSRPRRCPGGSSRAR